MVCIITLKSGILSKYDFSFRLRGVVHKRRVNLVRNFDFIEIQKHGVQADGISSREMAYEAEGQQRRICYCSSEI
jgi:hypothetical protein